MGTEALFRSDGMSLVGVVGLGTLQDCEEVLRCHQPDAFVAVVYIPKMSPRLEEKDTAIKHIPREQRTLGHRSFVQIKRNIRSSLYSLQPSIVKHTSTKGQKPPRLTSIQSITPPTSLTCNKNCSPSNLNLITFFLFV